MSTDPTSPEARLEAARKQAQLAVDCLDDSSDAHVHAVEAAAAADHALDTLKDE